MLSLSNRARSSLSLPLGTEGIGWRQRLMLAGPAVVASVAYVDPGNYATNIEAGARYGYTLLWVVVLANLVAMLFQSLSARLGIVTGKNLAELCRDHLPRPLVAAMWMVSELAVMATDLAEFLGGALGLSLLFGLPLLAGMTITAIVTYALLLLERRGFRAMELLIGGLVGIIALSYLAEMLIAPVDWSAALRASVTPSLPDAYALTIAVGIIGATVMPHAIFLHSGLTQSRITARNAGETARIIRFSNGEVIIALAVAGLVNMAMVMMSASAFHPDHAGIAEIETAYRTLTPILGGFAAAMFLSSLIASGISSSVVGTMAGQMIMQGFLRRSIPIWMRRLVTMVPAFIVVALGINATTALILSQVVLSIALPVPMMALIYFISRPKIMGTFRIRGATLLLAGAAAALVLGLNVVLLVQAVTG
ncbi:Nramp family divalent metal transporter [Paracoccus aminophilus]|uniref:Divalent metal cation transporter MntH n=1 Tax=Paracoccus aminophilus JCM 7686 TaxID=1367847 RepID=S5XKT2_PARAH|nr:Nramp family divalent metal transporter [Paracoccus aminophilus]AGT07824.1 manganese transport protein MntH [Paracoccus aminophilus JCM 7686]